MFGRIHFDAASLFPAMAIMTSKGVYVSLEDNMPSRLNRCYIKMFEFSFKKDEKCTKLDKNEQKRS